MNLLRFGLLVSVTTALLACSAASDPGNPQGQGSGLGTDGGNPEGSSSSSGGDSSGGRPGSDSGAHPGADAGSASSTDAGAQSDGDAAASVTGTALTGTIDGEPVVVTDNYSIVLAYSTQQGTVIHQALVVVFDDYANGCAIAASNAEKGSSTQLALQFDLTNVNQPLTPPPIALGVYPYDVSETNNSTPDANGNVLQLSVFYDVTDDTCHLPNGNVFAQAGTVTIASITSQAVTGSFDVMFPNDNHLTGTFASPLCDVPDTADGGLPVCE